ncbi:MAG: Sulfotransferase family [Actinomycetia bacterium]|nr:Sulfotransferase family [Actinomycetes bacterium]
MSLPELSASRAQGKVPGGQAVPVLFIAGFGRSGSTLLDRLLGSTPGLHSGGEMGGIWTQGLIEDRLCSCGTRFSCCPFWQAVGSTSFSSLGTHDIEAIVRYVRSVFPARKMWRLLSCRTRRKLVSSAPANFLDITARLYQGMRTVSTRQVVVDSSKLATYFVLLAHVSVVDVHVIHLVRDPRAVAHSWRRPRVADPDGRSTMPRFGAIKSAVLWLIMNVAVEWAARRLDLPYVRVRYEDLVEDPARIVGGLRSGVLGDAGPDAGEAGGLVEENVDLGVVHSISGNPMRFRQGRTSIVGDADWKVGPRGRRVIVAAITLPLRWRYGYR